MSSSRRNFLAAGLSLPVAGLAAGTGQSKSAPPARLQPQPESALRYRTLGKTGLKVTAVSFGCMITSDGSVIERAADVGINYFDTARGYQDGNNERMVGAALKGKRKNLVLSSKTHSRHQRRRAGRSRHQPARRSAPTTSTSGTCTPAPRPSRSTTNCWKRSASPRRRARSASPASARTADRRK